ncbi:NfeD family protein [Paenibacillus puerhi]|uniref:NfeD family protein n=1 Tax=Paenibacillus puerhi TaxID=2692622 RepID=UPI0013593623|nr:NfeD family protein [Paenibacillus puerhi]
MLEIYAGMLITGVLFALVTVLFGDLLSNALDGMFDWLSGDLLHFFQPMVLFSGITIMGGAGWLLTRYSAFGTLVIIGLAFLAAAGSSVLIYLLYVKPMENTDNSVAFSMKDLVGRIGEVSIPVPAAGCGEVLYRIGGSLTNQIAESFDGESIPTGTRVVTVEVRDGAVRVSPLETQSTVRSGDE